MSKPIINSGITLVDVRNEAMDTIRKIKSKEIDLDQAKSINNLLNTIVNTAKTQVDFLNALPKSVKDSFTPDHVLAIAGALRDRDAELDETLTEIENKKAETYRVS